MSCSARTTSGQKCRNKAQFGTTRCHVHKSTLKRHSQFGGEADISREIFTHLTQTPPTHIYISDRQDYPEVSTEVDVIDVNFISGDNESADGATYDELISTGKPVSIHIYFRPSAEDLSEFLSMLENRYQPMHCPEYTTLEKYSWVFSIYDANDGVFELSAKNLLNPSNI